MRVRVIELRKTCEACPAQWEGLTDDGRFVYVRYRWGWLQVGFGESLDAAVGSDAIGFQLGDGYDGYLDFGELIAATQDRVDWPVGGEAR